MSRNIAQGLTLCTFVIMYAFLEVTLFKELGIKGGLAASFYFITFGILSFAGLMYRLPNFHIQDEDEPTNCSPSVRGN